MLNALELSDLLATGSTFRTLQMLKRHPGLLSLSPEEVGCCSSRAAGHGQLGVSMAGAAGTQATGREINAVDNVLYSWACCCRYQRLHR